MNGFTVAFPTTGVSNFSILKTKDNQREESVKGWMILAGVSYGPPSQQGTGHTQDVLQCPVVELGWAFEKKWPSGLGPKGWAAHQWQNRRELLSEYGVDMALSLDGGWTVCLCCTTGGLAGLSQTSSWYRPQLKLVKSFSWRNDMIWSVFPTRQLRHAEDLLEWESPGTAMPVRGQCRSPGLQGTQERQGSGGTEGKARGRGY